MSNMWTFMQAEPLSETQNKAFLVRSLEKLSQY